MWLSDMRRAALAASPAAACWCAAMLADRAPRLLEWVEGQAREASRRELGRQREAAAAVGRV